MRLATFNVENLGPQLCPDRVTVVRAALVRARADVLCLQEVGSAPGRDADPSFPALEAVLDGTDYAPLARSFTARADGHPLPGQNIVVLSRLGVLERHQYLDDLMPPPLYRPVTADPRPPQAAEVRPDRPVLHVVLDAGGTRLHVVVVHLKSRIPVNIPGQKVKVGRDEVWRTASGWAEGTLLASLRRVGQALEVRLLVDAIFAREPDALIAVCGDFNADLDDVPLAAIRGDVEDTDNAALGPHVLVPCERTVPEPSRFSLYHHGRGQMFDHILVSRALLARYRGTEIHNELLHDESVAFATDLKFPESDHAPVVAAFDLTVPG